MLIRRGSGIPDHEVTDERLYWSRREFLGAAGAVALGAAFPATLGACSARSAPPDKLNSYEDITTYNNYYAFGTDESAPHENAGRLSSASTACAASRDGRW